MEVKVVRLDDVKIGDTLIADGGFDCMAAGPKVVVADEDGRLFVACSAGRHYIDGQEDEEGAPLVGLSRPD